MINDNCVVGKRDTIHRQGAQGRIEMKMFIESVFTLPVISSHQVSRADRVDEATSTKDQVGSDPCWPDGTLETDGD